MAIWRGVSGKRIEGCRSPARPLFSFSLRPLSDLSRPLSFVFLLLSFTNPLFLSFRTFRVILSHVLTSLIRFPPFPFPRTVFSSVSCFFSLSFFLRFLSATYFPPPFLPPSSHTLVPSRFEIGLGWI